MQALHATRILDLTRLLPGAIATMLLLEEGDMITIDVSKRLLQVDLSDAELAARRARWSAPEPNYIKGVMAKYAKLVSQADDGAVTGA